MPSYGSGLDPAYDSEEAQAFRERQRGRLLGELLDALDQAEAEREGTSVEEVRAQYRRDQTALLDRARRDWAAWNRGEWGPRAPAPPSAPTPPPSPTPEPEPPPAPLALRPGTPRRLPPVPANPGS